MIDTNAILLSDTYKQCHRRIYPKGLAKLVSYWTPRRSMFADPDDEMIFFGLQGFIKEYLIEYFNKNFFERSAGRSQRILSSLYGYSDWRGKLRSGKRNGTA